MKVRDLLDLSGKVALITGASRGLGLQMSGALAEMGAKVVLVARNADGLAEARAHLAAQGIDADAVPCDLAKADAITALVEDVVGRHGAIDILVNNAGMVWRGPAQDHPLDAWQEVTHLNLTATFLVTREVGRRSMIPRRYGRIIIISSILGMRGARLGAMTSLAYNTSKGGLINYTRALAGEWGRHRITVNAIAPGLFPSRMSLGSMGRNADEVVALTPTGRLGGDDDLKGLVVLLASDASAHISGQTIAVDGGLTAV